MSAAHCYTSTCFHPEKEPADVATSVTIADMTPS